MKHSTIRNLTIFRSIAVFAGLLFMAVSVRDVSNFGFVFFGSWSLLPLIWMTIELIEDNMYRLPNACKLAKDPRFMLLLALGAWFLWVLIFVAMAHESTLWSLLAAGAWCIFIFLMIDYKLNDRQQPKP